MHAEQLAASNAFRNHIVIPLASANMLQCVQRRDSAWRFYSPPAVRVLLGRKGVVLMAYVTFGDLFVFVLVIVGVVALFIRNDRIMTTRQTGGLHEAYKALLPASVSRRWLSLCSSLYCLCLFYMPLKGLLYYLLTSKGVFIFLYTQFVQCYVVLLLLTNIFRNSVFVSLKRVQKEAKNRLKTGPLVWSYRA
jgi:hypothetical protein